VILGVGLALLCGACAVPPEHAWTTQDGLVEIYTPGRSRLFLRRDHQLGRYDDLLIEHVGFRYGRSQRRLADHHEERIANMLIAAVQGSQDGAVGLTEEPGLCVLSVNFYVKDLEFYDAAWSTASQTSFVSSYGEATMIIELRDSLEDVPLARFVQRRDLGGGFNADSTTRKVSRLGIVIGRALSDMGIQLRRITPPTSRGWESGCRGGLSSVALGSH
jgi:hypothetical protein